MGTDKDIAQEFADLGIDVVVSQEIAEKQWGIFAREYRIVGDRAEAVKSIRSTMIAAIMAGDAEVFESESGVCIKQFIRHPRKGGPAELVYNPPTTIHVARGGTDDTPLAQKWARVAASLAGKSEGEVTAFLSGRDYSLMETIAQLFTLC